jgi:hypothetical protein
MRTLISVFALSLAGAAPTSVAAPDMAAAFVEGSLNVSSFERADVDLNGDGRSEVLIYVTDERYCGSGGCTLLVLSSQGNGSRVVLRAAVTRPPISLLPTATHGWRDIGVTVGGGGITRSYMARLRFNGQRYPSNPTVPPAIPLDRPAGTVLIGG